MGRDHTIVMEQGYSMKKPSEIIVELMVEGQEVIGVKVGGKVLKLLGNRSGNINSACTF
jgi:predicted PhzF superfamily epimerase YddE/YHI9